jgi:hypothetical protein
MRFHLLLSLLFISLTPVFSAYTPSTPGVTPTATCGTAYLTAENAQEALRFFSSAAGKAALQGGSITFSGLLTQPTQAQVIAALKEVSDPRKAAAAAHEVSRNPYATKKLAAPTPAQIAQAAINGMQQYQCSMTQGGAAGQLNNTYNYNQYPQETEESQPEMATE